MMQHDFPTVTSGCKHTFSSNLTSRRRRDRGQGKLKNVLIISSFKHLWVFWAKRAGQYHRAPIYKHRNVNPMWGEMELIRIPLLTTGVHSWKVLPGKLPGVGAAAMHSLGRKPAARDPNLNSPPGGLATSHRFPNLSLQVSWVKKCSQRKNCLLGSVWGFHDM